VSLDSWSARTFRFPSIYCAFKWQGVLVQRLVNLVAISCNCADLIDPIRYTTEQAVTLSDLINTVELGVIEISSRLNMTTVVSSSDMCHCFDSCFQ